MDLKRDFLVFSSLKCSLDLIGSQPCVVQSLQPKLKYAPEIERSTHFQDPLIEFFIWTTKWSLVPTLTAFHKDHMDCKETTFLNALHTGSLKTHHRPFRPGHCSISSILRNYYDRAWIGSALDEENLILKIWVSVL